MVKYIMLAIILNTILVIRIFTGQDVYLEIKAPASAEAGSTVDVEIELHKGQHTGFARFQQTLPQGVTASPVYPADMNFSFEENTLTMIWLSLPREEIIRVRYRIHIHERLKGDLRLDGTFGYVADNQRRETGATGMNLAINPSPGMDENLIVDIRDSDILLTATVPVDDGDEDVVAVRERPSASTGPGYIVNILVSKGDMSHFAKIEEIVPDGFTAVEVESQGGIFTFSNQRARIIWRNLPREGSFIVSYRLIPHEHTVGPPLLSGEFSFIHNDITESRRIAQRDEDLLALDEEGIRQLIASIPREHTIPSTVPPRVVRPDPTHYPAPVRPVPVTTMELNQPLEPESGVYYRVQLAAGRRPVDPDPYFRRLNITREVRSEFHEGWVKYSVGSFYDYKSARDYRVSIWNTTPVGDAFVSAYNDGLRITVQEALVIANHRWYR